MKIFFLTLFSILVSPNSYSFNFSDTIPELQNNTQFQNLLNQATHLRDSSFDASIKVGKQAISFADSLHSPAKLGASYKSLGNTYIHKGTFDSSMYYYNKAIEQFTITGDSLNVCKIIGNMGIIYRRTCKYDQALKQYFKAIKLYESLDNQKGLASTYFNIGGVYHMLGNLENALSFYVHAKNTFEKLDNKSRLLQSLINIGVIKYSQNKFEESLNIQYDALALNEELGTVRDKAIILLNIGQAYEGLEEFDKALDYYSQCENLRLKLNDIWGLGKIFTFKAVLYSKTKQNQLAKDYFKKAENANKENDLIEDLADTYLYYSEFLESNRDFPNSILYYKKYIKLKDSITSIFQEEKVAELTALYESEKKAKEFEILQQKTQIQNLELTQKNAWIIILTIVMILGIVAVLVSLRINRLRADHKIMDLRQKVLLTQMNPHFLFNSLTAIQSFILDEKNDDANNYLSRLASLVRGILENSREEFVSLNVEISTLKDYIDLQKLRFDNDITYEITVSNNIDENHVLIPPMLAQPFVENALIHGRLRSNPEAKINIDISLSESKQSIIFSITDNGIGMEEAKKQSLKRGHKSLATSIAMDRVKIYNFKSSKKMHFEIIDLKYINPNLHGTKVSYSIPLTVNNI